MPELLTIGEAADLLRLSASALYSQRHRGELPGVLGVKVGRKIVWRRSDLDDFLAEKVAHQLETAGSHG